MSTEYHTRWDRIARGSAGPSYPGKPPLTLRVRASILAHITTTCNPLTTCSALVAERMIQCRRAISSFREVVSDVPNRIPEESESPKESAMQNREFRFSDNNCDSPENRSRPKYKESEKKEKHAYPYRSIIHKSKILLALEKLGYFFHPSHAIPGVQCIIAINWTLSDKKNVTVLVYHKSQTNNCCTKSIWISDVQKPWETLA